MSNSNETYKRIKSAGVQGVRKTVLRRQLGAKAGKEVEQLLTRGLVFQEKKRGVVLYWSKDNYLQYLVNKDPKFRLIYDLYSNNQGKLSSTLTRGDLDKKVSTIASKIVTNKVSGMRTQMDKRVSGMRTQMDKRVSGMRTQMDKRFADTVGGLSSRITEVSTDLNSKVAGIVVQPNISNGNGKGDVNQQLDTLDPDQFRMEFDRTISEIPTAIGWVELGIVRERLCGKYGISKNDFYTLASQIFDQFSNRYELSSGGDEGVIVRGLLHGFVRRI